MNNSKKIGQNVRFRRSQLGITQDDLRYRMGYANIASISKIENGRFIPNRMIMDMLATALETTPFALGFVDDSEETDNTLGENIKLRRKALGLTQEDMREVLGYTSTGTLSQIEHGRFTPSAEMLEGIAKILQTTPADLMKGRNKIGVPTPISQTPVTLIEEKPTDMFIPVYTTGKESETGHFCEKISPVFGIKCDAIVCVTNDDMYRSGICSGDFLFLTRIAPPDRTENYIGVFSYDGTVMVRRCLRLDSSFILACDTDSVLSIPDTDTTLKYLGTVVSVMRSYK